MLLWGLSMVAHESTCTFVSMNLRNLIEKCRFLPHSVLKEHSPWYYTFQIDPDAWQSWAVEMLLLETQWSVIFTQLFLFNYQPVFMLEFYILPQHWAHGHWLLQLAQQFLSHLLWGSISGLSYFYLFTFLTVLLSIPILGSPFSLL